MLVRTPRVRHSFTFSASHHHHRSPSPTPKSFPSLPLSRLAHHPRDDPSSPERADGVGDDDRIDAADDPPPARPCLIASNNAVAFSISASSADRVCSNPLAEETDDLADPGRDRDPQSRAGGSGNDAPRPRSTSSSSEGAKCPRRAGEWNGDAEAEAEARGVRGVPRTDGGFRDDAPCGGFREDVAAGTRSVSARAAFASPP